MATKQFQQFRNEVRKAAKRLDRAVPDWYKVIDPSVLDLAHQSTCIVGQLGSAKKLSSGFASNGEYFNILDRAFIGSDSVSNDVEREVWGTEIDKRKQSENQKILRVTRSDFRNAVKKSRDPNRVSLVTTCVVGVAAKRLFGPEYEAGSNTVQLKNSGPGEWWWPVKELHIRNLTNLFDFNYTKLSGDKLYLMAKRLNLLEIPIVKQ